MSARADGRRGGAGRDQIRPKFIQLLVGDLKESGHPMPSFANRFSEKRWRFRCRAPGAILIRVGHAKSLEHKGAGMAHPAALAPDLAPRFLGSCDDRGGSWSFRGVE